ncbi:uncharacterized protein MONBRDRAFT_29479 [Monosiga brevicollis MX1]|uniref:3-beta hydroxysteroid dehydrogenase/isomerase domain-containing protein n=1 Tax=Monosiga brevicollis TaxID=81824 RepID=A9VB77_MONBE|nr:uncharacterized protein MONBRDRAFT_29479 [Monosiga brevicollis MX1]EDQ85190.1 predicted protein [Monosiga brevicollis MX1]|eukprot:XP_001750015.1 hypothetical protein [Monosiga brevicollis MX1]
MAESSVLITGAGGYVGMLLALRLLDEKPEPARLTLVDLAFPLRHMDWTARLEDERVEFVRQDLTDPACLKLFQGIDIVYHLASYGMSGSAQLQRDLVRAVNVTGTQHVLAACREHDVRACVYISTYNVVYAGNPIVAGGLDLPYVPSDAHVDIYSKTKQEAEALVLAANNSPTAGINRRLATIAIRPAAIYGEHETRHFPRIIGLYNQGLDFFGIGSPEVLCDWVHGDNLVQGIWLAGQRCLAQDQHVCGKAFPIADGQPVNNFFFIQDVLGLPNRIRMWVPTWLMSVVATATEAVHRLVGPVFPFEPFLTRAEVFKVGYTHFMDMTPVRADLGYEPIVSAAEGIARTRQVLAPLVRDARTRYRTLAYRLSVPTSLLFLGILFWAALQPTPELKLS